MRHTCIMIRSTRRRAQGVAAVAVVIGLFSVFVPSASAVPKGLTYTDSSGQSGRLSHAVVSGQITVSLPSVTNVTNVGYYVDNSRDGGEVMVADQAPYSVSLDANELSANGQACSDEPTLTCHMLLAVTTMKNGETGAYFARFRVGKAGASKAAVAKPAATTATSAPAVAADEKTAAPKKTATGGAPSDILDFSVWKLTLPVGEGNGEGCKPREVLGSELQGFSMDPFFMVNSSGDGVVFRANADGCTTKNSGYPRSELREMTPSGQNASWSLASGTHVLEARQAITHLPVTKPQTVSAQIHGGDDDVMGILATGNGDGKTAKLCARFGNAGAQEPCLDDNYVLGTPYDLKISATNGAIDVYYNGEKKITLNSSDAGCYFKLGNYTQSNLLKGDKADAYGEVVVYSASVSHS